MLLIHQILVRSLSLGAAMVALMACGQQGPLYIPPPDGGHRATLPETLIPALLKPKTAPAATPIRPTSTPQGTQ